MLGNSWPFPLKSKKKSVTSLIQLLSDEQCIESLPFSSPTCLMVGFSLIDGRILTKSPCFSARPSALQFKGGFSLSERIFFPARNVKMSDQQPINAVPKAFLTTPVVSFFFLCFCRVRILMSPVRDWTAAEDASATLRKAAGWVIAPAQQKARLQHMHVETELLLGNQDATMWGL